MTTFSNSTSADSPAAQVASIAFSDKGRQFPKSAALMVEWVLEGKINYETAHKVLDCVARDYEISRAKYSSDSPRADARSIWASTIENINRGH